MEIVNIMEWDGMVWLDTEDLSIFHDSIAFFPPIN